MLGINMTLMLRKSGSYGSVAGRDDAGADVAALGTGVELRLGLGIALAFFLLVPFWPEAGAGAMEALKQGGDSKTHAR
jgi:hypothetical protein